MLLNPYAQRLVEFSSFAFNREEVYKRHGGWENFFHTRMELAPSKVILEIGCSNAIFLTQVASENPKHAYVGLDWKYKVIYKGAKRTERMGLKNLAFLRAVAQELPKLFGEAELDEIWVLFPDPFAKVSQLKHRLIQEPFLLDAWKALKPGGRIHFKTDHPGYFQWVLALFNAKIPELPAYDHPDPVERGWRARQYQVRRLMKEVELPVSSQAAQQKFKLERFFSDFWKDPNVPADMLFYKYQTEFEKLFIKDELPIYYIELSKQQPAPF